MKTEQLTPEDVARRATSPAAALDVSIEVWTNRAKMDEEQLKSVCLSPEMCGLCQWYGMSSGPVCNANRRGKCPLSTSGLVCCTEFDVASEVLEHLQYESAQNVAEVRAAFWNMVARLESEKVKLPKEEPKKKCEKLPIRHGDYGIWPGNSVDPFVVDLSAEDSVYLHLLWPDQDRRNRWRRDNGCVKSIKPLGNIFDDLAALREDVTDFAIKSTHAGGRFNRVIEVTEDGDGDVNINANLEWSTFQKQDVEALILKLRQLLATAERKAEDDC
jgi:hypothetical protein